MRTLAPIMLRTCLSFAGLMLLCVALAQSAQAAGAPWKMLILVYRSIDADYVDADGTTKHLTATMLDGDVQNMVSDFLHVPHNGLVYNYSDAYAELEAHVEYVSRPLTHISFVSESDHSLGYWVSPDDVRAELDAFAPSGRYDSVQIFWQASHPDTGQSIPAAGWGWGLGQSRWTNDSTYATVFNLSWWWPGDPCNGEVFLHEWLHGVTWFYMDLGFPFPPGDLHGAEQNGYHTDPDGCWRTWLRDYMRGRVMVNGSPTGISQAAWDRGSITTAEIGPPKMPPNLRVSGATPTSVVLAWEDLPNEDGYKIYKWGYSGTDWTFSYLASVGQSVTSYTDSGLSCGTDYFYEVSAFNKVGESPQAGFVKGTTSPCQQACASKPAAPTLISPPKGGPVVPQVSLDWSDANCAKRYELQVRQGTATGALVVSQTTLTTSHFTTKALTRTKTYFWRVRACNSKGCSAWIGWWKFKVSAVAK